MKYQGRFITLEELSSIPNIQEFVQEVLAGNAKVYIGDVFEQGKRKLLAFELSDVFFKASDSSRLVLSDIGNQLRRYMVALGGYAQGVVSPAQLKLELQSLQERMALQLAGLLHRRAGLYFVGRFRTLSAGTPGI